MCNTKHVVHIKNKEYEMEDRGFVTYKYDRAWWVARVLQVNDSEIHLMFLHPFDPSKSFIWASPDILSVPASKVLKSGSRNSSRLHIYCQ